MTGVRTACPICGTEAAALPSVRGTFSGREFALRRCPQCRLGFIADPWTDYASIYDDAYYRGEGADPMVDYHFELEQPAATIRQYEWRGITRIVSALARTTPATRWLDYGCGNGGLVRHVRSLTGADIVGFDEGAIVEEAKSYGIPFLDAERLPDERGSFDVVTAIEVIEHVTDPLRELRQIRSMLRPGGLLFLTTGNAAPHAAHLERWRYVIPEIHIAFFEPTTLDQAMTLAGLRPARLGRPPGFDEVMKFKVLKNLGVRKRSWATDRIPARPLALAGDRIARVSDLRVGWAQEPSAPAP